MGSFSVWHWLIVLLVILIVFGAGKLPKVAGDVAQGIKNFKKGMQDPPKDETTAASAASEAPKPIQGAAATSAAEASKDKVA